MSALPTEASFLQDVANHEMTIVREDGVHRHVRFKQPKSINRYFDVTTWPGFLCYSGDMGCYVFSRLHDMFDFFRPDRSYQKDPDRLYVDPGYWGQKVEAIDRGGGLKEYDSELFKTRIAEWLDEAEASESVRRAVAREVLDRADDGEHEAIRAACEFEHEGFRFDDFYEVNVREYTYRFLWCCYALAWAVRKYDGRKDLATAQGQEVARV